MEERAGDGSQHEVRSTTPPSNPPGSSRGRFAVLMPGILVAATGVGAGDLLTASLGGSIVGLGILWAAVIGAALKWFLNEGIARWQMATGTTLLEGWTRHLGRWVRWAFLIYLIPWTFFTGGALVGACGVAGTSIFPIHTDPHTSKIIWGVVHSLVGLALVWRGSFRVFKVLMSLCIAAMFITVVATALLLQPDWSDVARGIFIPSFSTAGRANVLGLIGGVGGTVTLMSYGYWIRDTGRHGSVGLRACRIDLGVGYTLTGLFGVAMVIIGSHVTLAKGPGGLATVAVDLANQLEGVLGSVGKWTFLLGFWGAVFSSLLGVWQSVPYLFADFISLRPDGGSRVDSHDRAAEVDPARTPAYRAYLLAIALVPLPLLAMSVKRALFTYAVFGSLFMPLLALTLLILNNRRRLMDQRFRSGWITNIVLGATLVFFACVALDTLVGR